MQLNQRFRAERVLPDCNFTKSETPAHVFSCEFCESFKPIFLLKTGI